MQLNGGPPLYVLEDRLLRVANWEDQTEEDLQHRIFVKEERRLPISAEKTENILH